MLITILEWLVLGLVAGFIASKLINKTGEGLIMDIVLGVIGAVVGGFLSTRLLHGPAVSGLNITSLIIAVVGSIIVLLVYHMVIRRRRV
ncbi:MAG TPA: GlsB/YeaQ/YmgE family stress response membrane protein [Caulobacteraceae bacterium]